MYKVDDVVRYIGHHTFVLNHGDAVKIVEIPTSYPFIDGDILVVPLDDPDGTADSENIVLCLPREIALRDIND